MTLQRVLIRAYRSAQVLLPREFRSRRAEELLQAERMLLEDAAAQGVITLLRRFVHDMLDLAVAGARLRYADVHADATYDSQRKGRTMDMLLQEVRLAWKRLMRAPGFVIAAVLTLGAGLGCATAAFATLDTLLLRPLPHSEPHELYMVWQRVPEFEIDRAPMSYPTVLDLRANTPAFESLEAWTGGAALVASPEVERVIGARVTGRLFQLLGNTAVLGRTVLPADDAPDAEPVAVISWALWQRLFGGDEGVLGSTLDVRDVPHRIVGVMPRDFAFPSARAEFWAPLRLDGTQLERDMNFLTPIARLRDGVEADQAAASVTAVYGRLRALHPDAYSDRSVHLEDRRTFLSGDASRLVWLGTAAAAILLLVASANLANLMLVRGVGRSTELAVRAALGASRSRLAATLLNEGMLIGFCSAAFALAAAHGLITLVLALGPEQFPRRAELGLDARAIGFCIAAGLLCAVCCSLLPAWRGTRNGRALATRNADAGVAARRLQDRLVVAQVSLAFVLLVGALLLTSTLARLLAVPVGFSGERVLSAWIALPPAQYDGQASIDGFYDQLFERLGALPGVEQVGATWALPFSADYASGGVVAHDAPLNEPVTASMSPVRGSYFDTVGMRLLRGRDFASTDRAGAPPVAIVNETLARRLWPDRDAVGQYLGDPDDPEDRTQVIGVVNDVKRRQLDADTEPEIYLPHAQATWDGNLYLTIRTSGDPHALAPLLRAEVRALDGRLPVDRVTTLQELVSSSVATPRFRAAVIGAFSIAAAIITLLGIFAVQAVYAATHRRDAAVRMALGARGGHVTGTLMMRGLRLTMLGLLIGIATAAASTRVLEATLFGVSALDARTFVLAAASFLGAAALASYLPVRAVGRIDPMRVLREQ